MSSELSTNNMVVVSRVGDYWVEQVEAEKVRKILQSEVKGMIDLHGSLIAINSIDGVVTPDEYDIIQKKRRGCWLCSKNFWHERNDKCAHTQRRN